MYNWFTPPFSCSGYSIIGIKALVPKKWDQPLEEIRRHINWLFQLLKDPTIVSGEWRWEDIWFLWVTWKVVETKYMQLTNGPTTPNEIEAYEENEWASYAIFSTLSKTKLVKVVALDTAYEIWERLKNIYEGNDRVKLAKMQIAKGRYENLKMEEGEDITSYF